MNWYVKYEKTGKIDGPMTEEKATKAQALSSGSMCFSEEVLEPSMHISEKVRILLAEMKDSATRGSATMPDGILIRVHCNPLSGLFILNVNQENK